MTDERYEVLRSRHESLRSRVDRDIAQIREHLQALISEVQHLQVDIKPLLDDLGKRQSSEQEIANLRAKRDEIWQREVDRQRYEWQANLAVIKERQAELNALKRSQANVGKQVLWLIVAIMMWSFPVALIAAGLGAIPAQNQVFIFSGTAVMALGGVAVLLWETSKGAFE